MWVDVEGVASPSDEQPLTLSLLEILTVNMSPCFSFILVRKLAASLPNSKAWPSQGTLPRSNGGSPGLLQKPQYLASCDKAREGTERQATGKSEEADSWRWKGTDGF